MTDEIVVVGRQTSAQINLAGRPVICPSLATFCSTQCSEHQARQINFHDKSYGTGLQLGRVIVARWWVAVGSKQTHYSRRLFVHFLQRRTLTTTPLHRGKILGWIIVAIRRGEEEMKNFLTDRCTMKTIVMLC